MKVIFLDHDGVVCLPGNWGSKRDLNRRKVFPEMDDFDGKAVKNLNRIIKATGAMLVTSSDWRLYKGMYDMQRLYQSRGVDGIIVGMTPIYMSGTTIVQVSRDREILDFIKDFPARIKRYIAIDDLPLGLPEEVFVKTIEDVGLSDEEKVKEAIIKLGGEYVLGD